MRIKLFQAWLYLVYINRTYVKLQGILSIISFSTLRTWMWKGYFILKLFPHLPATVHFFCLPSPPPLTPRFVVFHHFPWNTGISRQLSYFERGPKKTSRKSCGTAIIPSELRPRRLLKLNPKSTGGFPPLLHSSWLLRSRGIPYLGIDAQEGIKTKVINKERIFREFVRKGN